MYCLLTYKYIDLTCLTLSNVSNAVLNDYYLLGKKYILNWLLVGYLTSSECYSKESKRTALE